MNKGLSVTMDKIVSLEDKIDALQTAQLDVAITMRQVAAESNTDRNALKVHLSTLEESLSEDFSGLERMKSISDGEEGALSEEYMCRLMQAAVQFALKRIHAAVLDDDMKKMLPWTCNLITFQCSPIPHVHCIHVLYLHIIGLLTVHLQAVIASIEECNPTKINSR